VVRIDGRCDPLVPKENPEIRDLYATMRPDNKPFQDFFRLSLQELSKLSDLGGALSSRTIDQLGFPVSAFNLCAKRYFHSPSSVNQNPEPARAAVPNQNTHAGVDAERFAAEIPSRN
jgi:hypothetical protein